MLRCFHDKYRASHSSPQMKVTLSVIPPLCLRSVTRADYLNTFEFLDKLAENLKMKLSSHPKL